MEAKKATRLPGVVAASGAASTSSIEGMTPPVLLISATLFVLRGDCAPETSVIMNALVDVTANAANATAKSDAERAMMSNDIDLLMSSAAF